MLEGRLTPSVSFLGVGGGDATAGDAILWTWAQDPASSAGVAVHALVYTDPALDSGLFYTGTTDPTQDYTIHLDATDLTSGTTYYYQFLASDGTLSPEGTFKTAPAPDAQVAVHFGFTGDADGQMRPYGAADAVTAPGVPSFANQKFDYFVWLGDTIYETASGGTGPNASPAAPNTSTASNLTPAGLAAMEQAYWAKYRQQLQPVSTGPDPGLQAFFASTGHYTVPDNHELGNKQAINGGAAPGSNPAGIGVDATNPANDVNTTGTFMNQTPVFKTLVQAYTDYQPIRVQTVNAPGDPRSNGTQQLYFAQQWGANSIFFNLDDRSYRDIRLKQADGTTDDTGDRADNPGRTMLGQTQLAWFEQGLLDAQDQGIPWKFVAISSPIDQLGAISSGADGGKSWMGGYRAERNQLLQFIADNHIDHVVFLTTDDHQVRVNELGYFTQFDANGTPVQSSYTRVPGAFQILVGPIGATAPDTITDHSIANIQKLAQALASQQTAAGVDPIGLDPNFPGLEKVSREGDPGANTNRSPFDFYSPDMFNYAVLDVDPSGKDLTVTIDGLNSYAVNTFPQPDAGNPVRQIMQFTISTDGVRAEPNSFDLTEGSATVNGPVATFTDPNGATLDHYTATIDWGDGTPPSAETVTLSGATFTVSGNHTYPEEGVYPITTTITHQGIDTEVTGTATVADAAVTLTPEPTPLESVDEGTSTGTVEVARFTDPGNPDGTLDPAGTEYTAVIDWGDGTPPTAVDSATGGITLVGTGPDGSVWSVQSEHTYADAISENGDAPYAISVTLTHDSALPVILQTTSITVNDPGPFGLTLTGTNHVVVGKGTGETGQALRFTGSFHDIPNDGRHTVTFHWGDGSPDTNGRVRETGTGGTATATHVYRHAGTYRVTETVRDDGSGVATRTFVVHITRGDRERDDRDRGSGRGDDLLLAGTTAPDSNLAALFKFLAEWDSDTSDATGAGGHNDGYMPTGGPGGTVHDNGAGNRLEGGAGLDWFFANLDGLGYEGVKDPIQGLRRGKIVTPIAP